MNMQTKREQWIEETLSSADQAPKLALSDELRNRLISIPNEVKVFNNVIPFRAVISVAASLLLLIAINIATVKQYKNEQTVKDDSIYSDYFSYLNEL
jgi:hypothetical protein